MNNYKLTREDQETIEYIQGSFFIGNLRTQLNNKFKVGDILIKCGGIIQKEGLEPSAGAICTNGYGVPRKYQVVYRCPSGLNYCKEINKKAKLNGVLEFCGQVGGDYIDDYELEIGDSVQFFDHDPEFVNASIFSEQYNPEILLKEKADKAAEIRKHNKAVKITFDTDKAFNKWYRELAPGYSFYTNHKTQYIVQTKEPGQTLKAMNARGKVVEFRYWRLRNGSLFSSAPRSMNELKT